MSAAGDDDADERAEQERREDPAVQLDAAELVGDDRHDRGDGERLEGDERDGQDEADGQAAVAAATTARRSAASVSVWLSDMVQVCHRPSGQRRGRTSGPRQALHDRGQLVDVADHERADAEPLAERLELVDEAVDRADEQVRRVEDLVLGQLDAAPPRSPSMTSRAAAADVVGER